MSKHSDRLRQKIAQEHLSKQISAPNIDLLQDLHSQHLTKSLDFLLDPALFKAWLGTRRSSKSTTAAIGAIQICLDKPRSKILYLGLTLESVLKSIYHEIFTNIFLKYKIPAEIKYKNQIVFQNGSIIYCVGVDAQKKDREKFRGFKGALIVVDECQSHENDLRVLINDVVGPSLADTISPIWLLGTAGNKHGTNYWFEICYKRLHPEWKLFQSSWQDNTAIDQKTGNRVCDNVRTYLEHKKKLNPGCENEDSYRQEWNGEWVLDKAIKIYKNFTDHNVLQDPLPPSFYHNATNILALDLGANDPTAFVILAFNLKYDNRCYVIDSYQESHMLVPDVVDKIRKFDSKYHFSYMVADSASLQIVETLQQYYSLPFEKADKQGKGSHQYTINSDFQLQSLFILPHNTELINQLQTVIWKESALAEGKYVEDPAYPNDLTDSLLYAHHFSRHMWYKEPPAPIPEATRFEKAILQGEKLHYKQEALLFNKQKYNPYSRKPLRT